MYVEEGEETKRDGDTDEICDLISPPGASLRSISPLSSVISVETSWNSNGGEALMHFKHALERLWMDATHLVRPD